MEDKLHKLCNKVFKLKKKKYSDKDCSKNIQNWDSLCHLNLIMEVSREFKVKFSMNETLEIDNIGNLKKILKRKIKK
tara:strand:- start:475 stop:705 length:231 start_codon:yes stop_codon:yes gene_type:complete